MAIRGRNRPWGKRNSSDDITSSESFKKDFDSILVTTSTTVFRILVKRGSVENHLVDALQTRQASIK